MDGCGKISNGSRAFLLKDVACEANNVTTTVMLEENRWGTIIADAGATSDNSNIHSSILDLLAAVQIDRDENEALEALHKINHAVIQQVLAQNDKEEDQNAALFCTEYDLNMLEVGTQRHLMVVMVMNAETYPRTTRGRSLSPPTGCAKRYN